MSKHQDCEDLFEQSAFVSTYMFSLNDVNVLFCNALTINNIIHPKELTLYDKTLTYYKYRGHMIPIC